MKKILIPCLLLLSSIVAVAQDKDMTPEEQKALKDSLLSMPEPSYMPLIIKINDSGSKYIRFITWHQIWLENQALQNSESNWGFRLRRSRLLAYAQISPRFLILTHFGVNNLTANNMDPIGDGRSSSAASLFLHAAWTEFRLSRESDAVFIGAGLHYWNGLSRITSASTLNFMTLDNYRQGWAQLGLSDQFARHLGVYAKGFLGKLRYTIAANNPIRLALGSSDVASLPDNSITYSGRRVTNDADWAYTAYADYQFFDKESNKLPYRVGSYLGNKRVFNIGAGFFNHNNGTVISENGGDITTQNVNHFAFDVYYDAPVGQKGAINAYVVYYNFDYGRNYNLGPYGTGNSFYGQLGYVLPIDIVNDQKMMPYISYSLQDYNAFENAGNQFNLGWNWFIRGHNAKVTLEYRTTQRFYTGTKPDRIHGLVLQTHIFL